MPGKVLNDPCVDCQSDEATLEIRNRRLCPDCFKRYVNSKTLKRMESYRFKSNHDDSERRLLLPVSGGLSSLVLLQVLDAQMQRQREKRNKTAYELRILAVENNLGAKDSKTAFYTAVQTRFPSVTFLPMRMLHEVFTLDSAIEDDLREFGLNRSEAEVDEDYATRIVTSTSSLTASADLQGILLRRLILACAKQQGCESILWGHSDSRLAAKALAGVAKGRGGSLPLEICDGPSTSGINFNYPLRDLFKPELSLYASLMPDVFSGLVVDDGPAPADKASIRNTSIDELLTNYINSQGEKYPSIMANVVRTASKLRTAESDGPMTICRVCIVQYEAGFPRVSGERSLCYACSRTRQDIRSSS